MRIVRMAVAAVLAVGTGVGGLASSAAPASADVPASNPIQYVTQSFWGDRTGPVTGTVHCPSGSRVVSSGASAPGGELDGIAPDINYFDAATATASVQGYLHVTVGCEPFAAISEVTTRTIALPYTGFAFHRGVVYCPPGMHAFGGGGYMRTPSGHISTSTAGMVSNAVSADGTGWTFAALDWDLDSLVVTTQCAPLRGSYVSQVGTPAPTNRWVAVYAPCPPGYTALSGGVYLSRLDGNEVQQGFIDYSVPASGNFWYTEGLSYENSTGNKLVALTQCIR